MDTVTTGNPLIVLTEGPDQRIGGRGTVWLPIVANNQPLAYHPPGLQFFRLLHDDSRQLRQRLSWCSHLAFAAAARAKGLANGDPWAHVDASGITPNEYARQYGCRLPDYYPEKGNWIESLVAGSNDVLVLFNALAASPAHANHLFGRLPQFMVQDKCGVGFAEGGQFGWYMCVMIGECVDVSTSVSLPTR